MSTKKIVLSGLLISIGALASHLIVIPVGVAKAYPIQHTINVIGAIILGPAYAVGNAFLISILRNILGVGSLLAFPGSMFGAFLAGIFYKEFKKIYAAAAGEIIGTGIIGSLVAFPISKVLLGSEVGAFFFIPPFILSSFVGTVLGILVIKFLRKTNMEVI